MVEMELSEKELQNLLGQFKKEKEKTGAEILEDSRKLIMEMGSLL